MKENNYREKIQAATQNAPSHLIRIIEKEILHYEILKFLNEFHYLNNLVFMGGTSLRFCYGSARYSEDLDFVIKKGFDIESMRDLSTHMKDYFSNIIGLGLHVNQPCSLKTNKRSDKQITVDKWSFSFETNLHQKDIKRQKVKMEIADIPAHSSEAICLQNKHQIFLSEKTNLIIHVESLAEILADKVIAFNVTNSNRIRYRDIWDIQWILNKNIDLNMDYVFKKIKDYHIENMPDKMLLRLEQLHEIIFGEQFSSELQRFLEPEISLPIMQDGNFKDKCYYQLNQLFEKVHQLL